MLLTALNLAEAQRLNALLQADGHLNMCHFQEKGNVSDNGDAAPVLTLSRRSPGYRVFCFLDALVRALQQNSAAQKGSERVGDRTRVRP